MPINEHVPFTRMFEWPMCIMVSFYLLECMWNIHAIRIANKGHSDVHQPTWSIITSCQAWYRCLFVIHGLIDTYIITLNQFKDFRFSSDVWYVEISMFIYVCTYFWYQFSEHHKVKLINIINMTFMNWIRCVNLFHLIKEHWVIARLLFNSLEALIPSDPRLRKN